MTQTRLKVVLASLSQKINLREIISDDLVDRSVLKHIKQHIKKEEKRSPLPSYTQFLKAQRKFPTEEHFLQYLEELQNYVTQPPAHPITQSEKTHIEARKNWSEIVSNMDQENLDRKKKDNLEAKIIERFNKLGQYPNLPQLIQDCLQFLQSNSAIVMTFNASFLKRVGLIDHHPLNLFERKVDSRNRSESYKTSRDTAERNLFKPIQEFLRNALLKNPAARPRYAALVLLDRNHVIEETTAYGRSFIVFNDLVKLNSLFNSKDSMNAKEILFPCTFHHMEWILFQSSDKLLNAIIQRVTKGTLPADYSQQLFDDTNVGGYIEAMLPSIDLLDPAYVQHIHINEQEYKLSEEDILGLNTLNILVTNAKESPYKKLCAELMQGVERNNIAQVKLLAKHHPTLLNITNRLGESPIQIAYRLGFVEMVDTFLGFSLDLNLITKGLKTGERRWIYAFEKIITRVLPHPKLTVELLQLITIFYPEKIKQNFLSYNSYLIYLCASNKMALANVILENNDLMKQFDKDHQGYLVYWLTKRKHAIQLQKFPEFSMKRTPLPTTPLSTTPFPTTPFPQIEQELEMQLAKTLQNSQEVKLDKDMSYPQCLLMLFQGNSDLLIYSGNELEKIIYYLYIYNDSEKIAILLEKHQAFSLEADQWLKDPNLSSEKLKTIINHFRNKLSSKDILDQLYLNNKINLLIDTLCELKPKLSKSELSHIFYHLLKHHLIKEVLLLLNQYKEFDGSYTDPSTLNTCLHLAVMEEKPDLNLIKSLSDGNEALHIENKEGKTALLIAAEKNNKNDIDILLAKKSNLAKYSSLQLEKIAIELIRHNYIEQAEMVLEIIITVVGFSKEVDRYFKNQQQLTLLTNCIIKFSTQGASAFFGSHHSFIAHLSLYQLELYQSAISNEVLVMQMTDYQWGEVLYRLVKSKHYEDSKNLLRKHPNANKAWFDPISKNTLLHHLVLDEKPDLNLVKTLIHENSNIKSENSENKTAFLIAAERNNPELITLFGENKACVDAHSVEQLGKIIFCLIKNNRLENAAQLIQIALKTESFHLTIQNWLQKDEIFPQLLLVFLKIDPNKIIEFLTKKPSLFIELCSLNRIDVLKSIFEHNSIISSLQMDQLISIFFALLKNKHYSDIKLILDKFKKTEEKGVDNYLIQLEPEVFKLFFSYKQSLKKYSPSQFEATIFHLLKSEEYTKAEAFIGNYFEFKNYLLTIINESTISLVDLELIIQFTPDLILKSFKNWDSYLSFLCSYDRVDLFKPLLLNETLMRKLSNDQLGSVFCLLTLNKHYESAKSILENYPSLNKGKMVLETQNTSCHLAVLDAKPDPSFINMLCVSNPYLVNKNKENKTPFLIAVERYDEKIIQIFMQNQETLNNYPADQLEKIIFHLMKNNKQDYAEKIMKVVAAKPLFLTEVDKWLKHPNLSIQLLKLVVEYCPQKITSKFDTFTCYISYLCFNQRLKLVEFLLNEKELVFLLIAYQLGEILIGLLLNHQSDLAKIFLHRFPQAKRDFSIIGSGNDPLQLAVLEEKPDLELVSMLILDNPQPTHKNKDNKTAFLIATEKNNPDLIDLFLKNKNTLFAQDKQQLELIIFNLAKQGLIDRAKIVLEYLLTIPDHGSVTDKWMSHPGLSLNFLKLIIKKFPKLFHLLPSPNLEEKSPHPFSQIGFQYLSELKSEKKPNVKIINLIIHNLIAVMKTPMDIVKLIDDIKKLPLYEHYYKCTSSFSFFDRIHWQDDVVNRHWVELIGFAKQCCINTLMKGKNEDVSQQEVMRFLETPILKNNKPALKA